MNKSPLIKKTFLPIFLASSLAVLSATIQANDNSNPPEVFLDAAGLTVSAPASVATLYRLELRVALPDGKVEKIVTDGEGINFSAFNLPDGSYNYETWAMATNENGKYETGLSRGKFKVVSGMVYMKPAAKSANPEGEEQGMLNPQNSQPLWQKILTTSLDFVIPSVHAANLEVSSGTPELQFEDTTAEGSDTDTREWVIRGTDNDFTIYDDSNDTDTNFTPVFKIEALGEYSGHAALTAQNTINSVVIEDTGNLSFADGAMYLSKVGGKLGLGTITPDSGIHSKVSGKTQVVKLENTAQSTWTMGQSDASLASPITDGDYQLNITANGNGGPTGTQFSIKDENGNVGIGTNNPQKGLHIVRDNGKAAIRVEENASTDQKRYLLQLKNNGATGAEFTDTSNGEVWQFATTNSGGFVISRAASGGQDFVMNNDGRVLMGPGPVTNFNLSPSGDLVIANGSVTATTHISSSSRTVKKDFAKVDADKVMANIKSMEVTEWRYKDANTKGRHIGPMAEDFYSLFGLGPDDKHVAATDMASIALIASKELQKQSETATAETAQIKAENAALKKQINDQELALKSINDKLQNRLASLEKLVTNLAAGEAILPATGARVALSK